MRQGDGRGARAGTGVPADIDRQRIGYELRIAERASRGGVESRQPDRRLSAEHRGGRRIVTSPEGWRSRVAGRDRIFRLPRTRWSIQPGEAEGDDRARAADPRHRDQVESGGETGSRRPAAAREDY